ncbi:MAG: S-methyl-5-thioribose-1-phosphate isomerase [Bdellovibrionaceae bacterium]|nr:S-methyl-5-thioribose-1-phosphate isomerase [Pseudobdellovibrionaceae bacterium]
MKNLKGLSISYENQTLKILDQCLLPLKEEWIEIHKPSEMVEAIKKLKVRGAPLIGVAAALSLAKFALEGASETEFLNAAEDLRSSRPTAVNLMFAIDKLTKFENGFNLKEIVSKAEQFFLEDIELCERISTHGEKLIADGDNVLTHCNTGGLATAGSGTALGVIKKAFENGKNIHVFVDETRPLLQGGRLTTWELEKCGIPYTLICDNMAASLMAKGKINKVIVGADRIATNGDFANKTGTYSLAVSSFYHRIPFYCAAPYTTIDFSCKNGQDIPIEMRNAREVRGVSGFFGEIIWAPIRSEVYNPAFDVTPFQLVSAWIFEKGVVEVPQGTSSGLNLGL